MYPVVGSKNLGIEDSCIARSSRSRIRSMDGYWFAFIASSWWVYYEMWDVGGGRCVSLSDRTIQENSAFYMQEADRSLDTSCGGSPIRLRQRYTAPKKSTMALAGDPMVERIAAQIES